MNKHRVLLIGCGEHSLENLVPSLAGIESIELVALCDPEPRALSAASRWFPTALQSKTFDSKLIDSVSAVVVAATPQVHEAAATMAIELGKPIFVEKPPTSSTAGLRALAKSAKDQGVITCVGHNLRHSEAALQVQSVVLSQGFGKPVAMEMRYMASKPRGDRWGLNSPLRSFLLSHANHAIDLMIYQMGPIDQTVAARAWPDVGGGAAIAVQFVFKSGAVGNLLASSYAPYFTVAATILSDSGMLVEMNGLNDVTSWGGADSSKRWGKTWRPRTLETGYRYAGYQTELERFFQAVSMKSPERVHPSFDDEVAIYEAMDRIEHSIARN
jgi:predicted dehydrogenase